MPHADMTSVLVAARSDRQCLPSIQNTLSATLSRRSAPRPKATSACRSIAAVMHAIPDVAPLSAVERPLFITTIACYRPQPVTGEIWERPPAANAETQKAAARTAQTRFAPGTSGSECIAATGPGWMYFGTRPGAVSWTIGGKQSFIAARGECKSHGFQHSSLLEDV